MPILVVLTGKKIYYGDLLLTCLSCVVILLCHVLFSLVIKVHTPYNMHQTTCSEDHISEPSGWYKCADTCRQQNERA